MKKTEEYRFLTALRPFSLVISLVSAALGVLLAWQDGYQNALHALLIVAGAIMAQAAVNLINDLEDLPQLPQESSAPRKSIWRNTVWAALFFVAALAVAAYFIVLQGWEILALVVAVTVLALSYNLGPINFKHRGLALIQVFFLMGICLVEGAYFAMAGSLSMDAFWLSLPISLLISLVLLSNELRDWEDDSAQGVGTLTVRIGYPRAVALYATMIVLSYVLALLLLDDERLYRAWLLLLPLPLLYPIFRHLGATERSALTPMTGRFFLVFGLAWLVVVGS